MLLEKILEDVFMFPALVLFRSVLTLFEDIISINYQCFAFVIDVDLTDSSLGVTFYGYRNKK